MAALVKRPLFGVVVVVLVVLTGALLRGWLVPAHRGDLAPEAYGFRLRLPWRAKGEVTVFFPTPEGGLQVAVRRAVSEPTPLAALRELAAGPAPESGLAPALPAGLSVDSVTLDGTAVSVSVSGWDPAHDDPSVEPALGAMTRTLGGLPGGLTTLALTTPSGHRLGPTAIEPPAGGVIYLWRGLPVPTPAALPTGTDRPAAAVTAVLTQPAPAGADPMPPGVRLLGIQVKGDTAKVSLDLSPGNVQELIAGRWQFAPYAMALVHTLTELESIRRVQFDFPNLPPEARRQCRTPLGVPLVRPDAERPRGR